jgi:hypothetical protein
MLLQRLWNQFWRAFPIFYLFTLGRRARPRPTAEALAREFSFFRDRLAPNAEFLGGSAPDTVDLQPRRGLPVGAYHDAHTRPSGRNAA